MRASGPDGIRRHAVADGGGAFRSEDVPAGDHVVELGAPRDRRLIDADDHWELVDAQDNRGRYAKTKYPNPWGAREPPQRVTVPPGGSARVVLRAPGSSQGRIDGVVRFGGEPLAGVIVQLAARASEGELGAPGGSAVVRTDRAGVGARIGGSASLSIGAQEVALLERGQAFVDFEVPARRIAGGVVDATTGAPVDGARLWLIGRRLAGERRGHAEQAVRSDGAGRAAGLGRAGASRRRARCRWIRLVVRG